MQPSKRRRLPNWFPVDPEAFAWDREIKEMGLRGFYATTIIRHIAKKYGKEFTPGQIYSRLHKMDSVYGYVSPSDVRRGKGGIASKYIREIGHHIDLLGGSILRSPRQIERQLQRGQYKRFHKRSK